MKALVCDGCGKAQPRHADWETVGVVEHKDYCPSCADTARDYLARRDDLHDKLALMWKEGLDNLDAEFGEYLNDLPM